MRKCYVYIDGVAYEKGTEPSRRGPGADVGGHPAILRDVPDFISPIDGTVVRGRAGIRDHCARHNVVPTSELAGLPTRQRYTADSPREDIKQAMIRKGYWDRKNEYAK